MPKIILDSPDLSTALGVYYEYVKLPNKPEAGKSLTLPYRGTNFIITQNQESTTVKQKKGV